jgi:hypothetical protein
MKRREASCGSVKIDTLDALAGLDPPSIETGVRASRIIAQGTDWRFFNELKRELKS